MKNNQYEAHHLLHIDPMSVRLTIQRFWLDGGHMKHFICLILAERNQQPLR